MGDDGAAAALGVLLAGIADDPGRRLSQLPLLDETESRRVIADWKATAAEYPREATLHDLFFVRAHLASLPDASSCAPF